MHFTSIITAAALATIASAVSCGGFGNAQVNDARTCADLLRGKGSQSCGAPANSAPQMCHQGTARVYAVSNNGQPQSTTCSDAAAAVDRIIAYCQNGNNVNGKENTSNPSLRVELHN